MALIGTAVGGADSPPHSTLQSNLVNALRSAFPIAREVGEVTTRSNVAYRQVGEILVCLRHEVRGSDGQADLRGRSQPYRKIVREAYVEAGAGWNGPVAKRLTAGVAYWVRKILLERYGEDKLLEMGIVSGRTVLPTQTTGLRSLPKDARTCLGEVIGALNALATDPRLIPTEDLVQAAARAVMLLRKKLDITSAA